MRGSRGRAMGDRVIRTARALGFPGPDLHLLERAHDLAMEPRDGAGLDDHDPRYLHPGRSVLVALQDGGVREVRVLAALLCLDSAHPGLQPGETRIEGELGVKVRGIWETMVRNAGDGADLVELLELPDAVRGAVLSERLDRARHAHLLPEVEERRREHRVVEGVFAPLAEHAFPELARRYRYWCRTFPGRFLRSPHRLDIVGGSEG